MRPPSALIRVSFLLAILSGFSGCASSVRVDLAGSHFHPMEQPEGGIAMRVTDRLAAWEDALVFSGTEVRIQTGKVYNDYFELTEGEPVTMDLVESRFSKDETLQTGFEGQMHIRSTVTYAATVAVTVGGRRHLMSAAATSKPRYIFNEAAREALVKVLDEFVRQAEVIIAAEIPAQPRRADGALGSDLHR